MKYAWYEHSSSNVSFAPIDLTNLQFDSNGATGGCQAVYTVYQAPNFTVNEPPVCRNLTYPQTTLGVIANVQGGWSQYGWVPQAGFRLFGGRTGA